MYMISLWSDGHVFLLAKQNVAENHFFMFTKSERYFYGVFNLGGIAMHAMMTYFTPSLVTFDLFIYLLYPLLY